MVITLHTIITMDYSEGKEKFIKTWGELGTNWGINKTMGQIHGLLLIGIEPKSTDDIMGELKISRGNVNMNLRMLVDWGLAHKSEKFGDRKDYYVAEKDIWTVFRHIIRKRKEKELHPMIHLLEELEDMSPNDEKSAEFIKMMNELSLFSSKADRALDNLVSSKSNILVASYLKFMR